MDGRDIGEGIARAVVAFAIVAALAGVAVGAIVTALIFWLWR